MDELIWWTCWNTMSVILFGIAPSLVVSFDSSLTPHFFYQTITILPERLKGKFFGRSQHKCLVMKHLKEERKWNRRQCIKFLTLFWWTHVQCHSMYNVYCLWSPCWLLDDVQGDCANVHLLHHRIFPCCCCFTHRVNQKNQKTKVIWERILPSWIRSTHNSNEGPCIALMTATRVLQAQKLHLCVFTAANNYFVIVKGCSFDTRQRQTPSDGKFRSRPEAA